MVKASYEVGRTPKPTTYEYELEWEEAPTTNIVAAQTDMEKSSILYNMKGQRVNSNYHGIVVANGQKYFQK